MSGFRVSYIHIAVAALAALFVSSKQFRFFDCNGMPTISVVAGAITIFLAYALAIAFYRIITTPNPTGTRLRAAVYIGLIGGTLLLTAGFFAVVSHVCP
jgi:hypothetical protein